MKEPLGPVTMIVSGGQTGADRAALDWAISRELSHGGWCPRGRRAEDGMIPDRYKLQEMNSPDYADRTRQNVLDADATVVFTTQDRVSGGTSLTCELARGEGKPLLLLNLSTAMPGRRLFAFLRQHRVKILNIAGPRASHDPEVAAFVSSTLDWAAAEFAKLSKYRPSP